MAAPTLNPAPAPHLFLWKCSDPTLEVRIQQTDQNVILQIYNAARAMVADALNYNPDHMPAKEILCLLED